MPKYDRTPKTASHFLTQLFTIIKEDLPSACLEKKKDREDSEHDGSLQDHYNHNHFVVGKEGSSGVLEVLKGRI